MENDAESSTNPISQGCGSNNHISVQISPTTGGDFALTVDPTITIESLKKIVSKKLKVPRDRICLLFREKQLQEGNLQCNGVTDGSKITLLPNVETGLIAQKPEIGIMQALESLNDTQVNDFLCGKAPLNLTMRLGGHMMLIQLQLSTVQSSRHSQGTPASSSASASSTSSTSAGGISTSNTSTGTTTRSPSPTRSSSVSHCPCRPPSLTQASRNLQHTLRRLSADVLSGRDDWGSASSHADSRRGSIYSGTFSGALNPALQDTRGRPRRDVATIVHILNDLLCSAPAAELRRVSRRAYGGTSVTQTNSSTSQTASSPNCLDSEPGTSITTNTTSTSISAGVGPGASSGVGSNKMEEWPTQTQPQPSLQQNINSDTLISGSGNGISSSSATSATLAATSTQWDDTSDDQNNRTRGKLEQLRLVMGERRERRKQRKQKVQPYTLPIPVSLAAEAPPSDTVTA